MMHAPLITVSDERLEELCVAAKDAEHAVLFAELQWHRERVCRECEGNTFIQNPSALWYRDSDGCEGTNDPEEIECPRCNGVGYEPPYRKPAERLPQVERDDGEPF